MELKWNCVTHKLKLLILGCLILFLFSCGDGSASLDESGEAPQNSSSSTPTRGNSLYFTALSDLPDCDEVTAHSLAYIQEDKKFYVCKNSSWGAVELGTSSSDPFEIVGTYYAMGDGTNLCTKFSPDDTCYLSAVALDVFGNGNWQVRFVWNHMYNDGYEIDTTDKHITFTISNPENGSIVLIDRFVMRTGSSGTYLWGIVKPDLSSVELWIDYDGDLDLTTSDIKVATYSLVKQTTQLNLLPSLKKSEHTKHVAQKQ